MKPEALDDAAHAFLTERHLATLSLPRPDGSIQVVAIAFTHRDGIVRVITGGASVKARRLADHPGLRANVCQVDGGRWLSLEGPAVVTDDPERVALAVELYAARYRQPADNPDRVAIEMSVDRVTGRW
jgi:PPOX class probable F420-dependent enzyme